MPPKKDNKKNKKGQKMSLDEFNQQFEAPAAEKAPSTLGGWGDRMSEEIDNLAVTGITTEELREQSGSGGYGGRQPYRESSYEPSRENRSFGGSRPEGRYGEDRPPREQRQRQADSGNLPTEPPFVIYIGNLAFQVTKDDIADFFGNAVEHIVLPVDHERDGRIKGHGYVEFADLESMRDALDKHGRDFMGRAIRVDVTEPQTALKMCKNSSSGFGGFSRREGDRDFAPRVESVAEKDSNWRGKGAGLDASPFGNKRGGGRFGGDRGSDRYGDREGSRYGDRDGRYGDRDNRYGDDRYSDRPSNRSGFNFNREPRRENANPFSRNDDRERERAPYQDEPTERPKINLRPRDESAPASSGKQNDLFGGGKAWEETDELRKKLDQLEVQGKKSVEDASKKFEEERSKTREERSSNPFGGSDERREKKTLDFSKFGKGNRDGEERTSGGGKREYKKKEEQSDDGFTSTSNVPSTATASKAALKKEAQNASLNRFGALGEEDLE
ncbi:RNA-binding protein sce3 [Acrasis kona]|uniref:RNA-binding protein sce3 n=1 Tax=Acrasis kona TaxID=1008807 RepID=A0AAW2ZB32_9EUKA